MLEGRIERYDPTRIEGAAQTGLTKIEGIEGAISLARIEGRIEGAGDQERPGGIQRRPKKLLLDGLGGSLEGGREEGQEAHQRPTKLLLEGLGGSLEGGREEDQERRPLLLLGVQRVPLLSFVGNPGHPNLDGYLFFRVKLVSTRRRPVGGTIEREKEGRRDSKTAGRGPTVYLR
jgi:hypothetical protein